MSFRLLSLGAAALRSPPRPLGTDDAARIRRRTIRRGACRRCRNPPLGRHGGAALAAGADAANAARADLHPAPRELVTGALITEAGAQGQAGRDPEVKKRLAEAEDRAIQEVYVSRVVEKAATERRCTSIRRVRQGPSAEGGGQRPPHPGHEGGGRQGGHRRAQQGRRFRQAGQGEIDRSGQGQRRRSRLVHHAARWCRNSPTRRSSSRRASTPRRRSRRSSAGTSSRSRTAAPRRRRPSRRARTELTNEVARGRHRRQDQGAAQRGEGRDVRDRRIAAAGEELSRPPPR